MDGMTIDEAIKHCEEVAEEKEGMCEYNLNCSHFQYVEWKRCASEHRQLAAWLRELKMYREVIDNKSFKITDPLDPHRHHVLVVKVTDLYNDFFDF